MFDDMILSSLDLVTKQNLDDLLEVGNITQDAYDKAIKVKSAQ